MPMPADHPDATAVALAGERDVSPDGALAGDPPIVLATHDLTKRFGNTLAVDRLNLTVRRGDVFGFLGPNGAGKTTTIRMIGHVIQMFLSIVNIFSIDGNHHIFFFRI